METKTKPNLFSTAKKSEPEEKKCDKHAEITLPESKYSGISEKLIKLQSVRDKLQELEAEAGMMESEIKEIGRNEYLKLYENSKLNPGSFRMKGERGGCFLVIPTDRYLSIKTEESANQLNQLGDLAESKTVFSFNPDLLEKYGETISTLILESEKISDEDKPKLIEAKTTYNVKKGSIDRLLQFGNKMKDVFFMIQPVFQLKNCK